MANRGVNYGQDISLVPGTRCLTNTSLHRFVCGGSAPTSFTPDVPNTVPATQVIVGVIQTPNLSAGSTDMSVRPMGISAVLCAGSIDAFAFCKVDTASLPGYVIAMTQNFSAGTAATLMTNSLAVGIAGISLETGSTLQKIEFLVRPFVQYGAFV